MSTLPVLASEYGSTPSSKLDHWQTCTQVHGAITRPAAGALRLTMTSAPSMQSSSFSSMISPSVAFGRWRKSSAASTPHTHAAASLTA